MSDDFDLSGPDFKNEHEDNAFYNHKADDRTTAITLGALIETRLTDCLKLFMVPDPAILNEMFQPSGALADFGTKIRLSYLLGLLDNEGMRELLIINKIRNAFAHRLDVTDFEQQPIKDWIEGLPTYQKYLAALKIRRAALTETSPANERIETYVLGNELTCGRRGQFHFCMRIWFRDLTRAERIMARKLRPAYAARPMTQPPS